MYIQFKRHCNFFWRIAYLEFNYFVSKYLKIFQTSLQYWFLTFLCGHSSYNLNSFKVTEIYFMAQNTVELYKCIKVSPWEECVFCYCQVNCSGNTNDIRLAVLLKSPMLLLIFCSSVLSIIKRGYISILVNLFAASYSSIPFCFTYFEALF